MPPEDIYPYTAVPAFMTWEIPTEGVTLRWWQDGRCAMCGHAGSLVEDHCHVSGLTRGLLCRSCNMSESNNHHAAWLAWRAGLNPCRLLGVEEEYIPLFGGEGFDSVESRLHFYLVLVERCAEAMGRQLTRPIGWPPIPARFETAAAAMELISRPPG